MKKENDWAWKVWSDYIVIENDDKYNEIWRWRILKLLKEEGNDIWYEQESNTIEESK